MHGFRVRDPAIKCAGKSMRSHGSPYGILPIFGLFNPGVVIDATVLRTLPTAVPLGIMVGLVLGKSVGIGIGLASWCASRLGLRNCPKVRPGSR